MSAVAAMIARGVGRVALGAAATLTVLILSVLALIFALLVGAPLKRLGV